MKQSKFRKSFRKFQPLEFYSDLVEKSFTALPFNFERLSSGKELLINMLGDFLIVPEGTVKAIVKNNLGSIDDDVTKDLVASIS